MDISPIIISMKTATIAILFTFILGLLAARWILYLIAVIKFPYLIETSPTVNAKVEKSTFPVTIEIEGITISLTKDSPARSGSQFPGFRGLRSRSWRASCCRWSLPPPQCRTSPQNQTGAGASLWYWHQQLYR